MKYLFIISMLTFIFAILCRAEDLPNGSENMFNPGDITIASENKPIFTFRGNGEVEYLGRVIDVDKEFVSLMKAFLEKAGCAYCLKPEDKK